jgi:four helix bundle protein
LRAARSATSNIAEGYGRFHYLDNAKFCSNARGSCWEVLDHLITANDEELILPAMLEKGRTLVDDAVRLLNGYMNYLKRSGAKSPREDH